MQGSTIKITGGKQLSGTITPSGNKNAVLPILCGTVLTDQPITINNIPDLTDVNKIIDILTQLGANIFWNKEKRQLSIHNQNLSLKEFDGRVPLGMRASLLLIAPLLVRFRKITIDNEIGGCTLGIRDIDPHITMLAQMGARVEKDNGKIYLSVNDQFNGAHLWPNYASVTGTENVIMAAVLANGTTTLTNAASEPHVQDLCHMLTKMGADIEGIGSSKLIINGVTELKGADITVSSDHHEITSFLALGAMTGGEVRVENALPQHFPLITHEFAKLGVKIEYDGDVATVRSNQTFEPEKPFTENYIPRIEAAPWPYFPVDLLPLMIALSLKTKGPTRFWNKVYEGGLFWVPELVKMGAKIEVSDPHRIIVLGPTDLTAASIDCPYIIRATVGLMMATMAAKGTSTLRNIDTIHRAHPNFLENLRSLGAEIEEG